MSSIYKTRSPVHRPTRAQRSDDDRSLDRPIAKRDAAAEIDAELADILEDIDDVLKDVDQELGVKYSQLSGE